jgi:hypothetical protein
MEGSVFQCRPLSEEVLFPSIATAPREHASSDFEHKTEVDADQILMGTHGGAEARLDNAMYDRGDGLRL